MITLEDARRVVSAAEEKAREMEPSINIAVLDAGRNLKYFVRMEDVWLGGIGIAVGKVYTSTSFKMSHAGPGGAGAAGTAALWINTTNNSHVMIFIGGIPIQRDGRVVGHRGRQWRHSGSGPASGRGGHHRLMNVSAAILLLLSTS